MQSRRPFPLAVRAACKKPQTPEAVVASAKPGDKVTVQGTAFTVTFDNVRVNADDYPAGDDRWVLIRTVVPKGVTLKDINHDLVDDAWSLGIHLTADQIARRAFRFPAVGDTVRAAGTFKRAPWSGRSMAMVDDVTELTAVSGAPAPKSPGDSCAVDMECDDDLVCD